MEGEVWAAVAGLPEGGRACARGLGGRAFGLTRPLQRGAALQGRRRRRRRRSCRGAGLLGGTLWETVREGGVRIVGCRLQHLR